jgi:hypothetical protein
MTAIRQAQAHGDTYEDDAIAFDIADCEGNRIRVRVGPVHEGDAAHPVPGVWISFSGRDGEHIVISPETFRALAKHVKGRLSKARRVARRSRTEATMDDTAKQPLRIEHLPDGRIRIHHGPNVDTCPLCGGKGSTHTSWKIGPDFTELGPKGRCLACRGTGRLN